MGYFKNNLVLYLIFVCAYSYANIATNFLKNCINAFSNFEIKKIEYQRTQVAGIPDRELKLFRQIPFGEKIRLSIAGEQVKGFVVDLRFRSIKLFSNNIISVPLEKIASFELIPVTEKPHEVENYIKANKEGYRHRINYLEFLETSKKIWIQMRERFISELEEFRKLNRHEQKKRLDILSRALNEAFSKKFPVPYGLHMNFHGGIGYQYVDDLGIRATPGDSMIISLGASMPIPTDLRKSMPLTVYYYDSKESSFAKNATNPEPLTPSNEFHGHYLIVFDITKVMKNPNIEPYPSTNGHAFSVKSKRADSEDVVIGVPIEAFLLPPLRVMTDIPYELGMSEKLTYRESQFITLRHLMELLKFLN